MLFQLPCDNMHQDAVSAVGRAKTPECRDKLAEISCQHEKEYMFAESLPRFCPLKGNTDLIIHVFSLAEF